MERAYTLSGFNYGLQDVVPKGRIYNSFFYPNICHVCKHYGGTNLISCSRCKMISYCSSTHRMQHLPQHKDFCEVLVRVLAQSGNQGTDGISFTASQDSKFSLINSVRKELPRNLQIHEEQMIMFAKGCLVCHRSDNLLTCQFCFVSNYCANHQQEFTHIHPETCETLKLCLDLDVKIVMKKWYLTYAIPTVENFPNVNKPVVNIDDFVVRYMKQGKYEEEYVLNDYLYSDLVSGPLTLQYALKEISELPKSTDVVYTIHIINADCLDRIFVAPWELLLHLFSQIKTLTIVIITPQIENVNIRHNICRRCQQDNKILQFECYPMFYANYIDSAICKKPNVIVGYQVNFDRFQYWSDILNIIRRQPCPFLLTVKSFSKAESVFHSITRFMRSSMRPFIRSYVLNGRIIENRFFSLRPHRDVLHGTFYRNKYIISFKSLHFPELPQEYINPTSINCHL